jgi:hypothetical protein
MLHRHWFSNSASKCALRKVRDCLKLNGTRDLHIHANGINLLIEILIIISKNTEILLAASKGAGTKKTGIRSCLMAEVRIKS